MKKLLTIVAATMLAFGANAAEEGSSNAGSITIGGSLGLSNSATSYDGTKISSEFGFGFAPKVMFGLGEKFSIGGEFSFTNNVEKKFDSNGDEISKYKESEWDLGACAELEIVEFGKFALAAEGVLSIGGSNEDDGTYENNWFNTKLFVTPILEFKANNHITFETGLNFLKFGAAISINSDDDETKTDFGMLVNSNNVANVGALTIGFNYTF